MAPTGNKVRILVVDNNPVIVELTAKWLGFYGFGAEYVLSGEDAISQMGTGKKFNLVLMDIDLGSGINGFETAEKIKEISDIPIVFYSAHSETEYIQKARKISRYGYLIRDGNHYAILHQVIDLVLSIYELYELHKLKDEYIKYKNTQLDHSVIISALCDSNLAYTWINNPHPDFKLDTALGNTDPQIEKNEGTEELYDLKNEVFKTGNKLKSVIEFPLRTGILRYSIQAFPMLIGENDIVGVKTIGVLK